MLLELELRGLFLMFVGGIQSSLCSGLFCPPTELWPFWGLCTWGVLWADLCPALGMCRLKL